MDQAITCFRRNRGFPVDILVHRWMSGDDLERHVRIALAITIEPGVMTLALVGTDYEQTAAQVMAQPLAAGRIYEVYVHSI